MLKLSNKLKIFFSELKLVYFGTGEFAVPPLEKLLAVGVHPLALVTSPDTKAGRDQMPTPSPVKIVGLREKFLIWQPEKLREDVRGELKKLKPDVVVLSDYGKIIPQALLDIPKYGFINIHPSLLPKYRGASPIEGALLAGEAETGVTIMQIDALLDHGFIIAHKKSKIKHSDTSSSFFLRNGSEFRVRGRIGIILP